MRDADAQITHAKNAKDAKARILEVVLVERSDSQRPVGAQTFLILKPESCLSTDYFLKPLRGVEGEAEVGEA